MGMQKKAKAPEPAGESAPMWIVSFADLVTLMMSFFVVLYALKQGGAAQQMQVAAAIKAKFDPNYIPSPDSMDEWDIAIRRAHGLPGPPFQNTGGNAPKPTDGADGRDPQVTNVRDGQAISTGGKITFDENKTVLDATSMETLKQLAALVRGKTNILYVKGHASNDELRLRPDDPQGVTISYERSMRVIDELVKMGIDRRVLRPVPCGTNEPFMVGVYDAAALRLNRRVEINMTESTLSQFSPTLTVSPTTNAVTNANKDEH